MEGDLYATWRPRGKNRLRIAGLSDDDPDRVALMDRLTTALAARQAGPSDLNLVQALPVDLGLPAAPLLLARPCIALGLSCFFEH